MVRRDVPEREKHQMRAKGAHLRWTALLRRPRRG